jgi:hypothetical protein
MEAGHMTKQVMVIFTAQSIENILKIGGSSAWRLDRNHARKCQFAVCTRNAKADWVQGPEDHHSAFLVGKIKDVVPHAGRDGRFVVEFSEYALVNVPDVWKGDRNPIRYASSLEFLEIEPSTLKWKPMPPRDKQPAPVSEAAGSGVTGLTMADAKKGLAITFGVAPEAIEITIRG